jgi:hypothetical protein
MKRTLLKKRGKALSSADHGPTIRSGKLKTGVDEGMLRV